MANELDHILKNSEKAELLEEIRKILEDGNPKLIVVCVNDHEEDSDYTSQVIMLGVDNTYEALGMLEIGKEDIREKYDS